MIEEMFNKKSREKPDKLALKNKLFEDKQEIAHLIEREISLINIDLRRLDRVYQQTIDSHLARDIYDVIQNLVAHKKKMEDMLIRITEDAKNYGNCR